MLNTDTQARFKESPNWLFTVPRKWGALQRAPCLLWYLSACWRAAIRRPLGSLRWRKPNSPCQASINISFVFIVHYARAVSCGFFASFCFAVSACLAMLCSYSTCLVGLCSTDKMKSWFACSPVSSRSLSLYRRLSGLSATKEFVCFVLWILNPILKTVISIKEQFIKINLAKLHSHFLQYLHIGINPEVGHCPIWTKFPGHWACQTDCEALSMYFLNKV